MQWLLGTFCRLRPSNEPLLWTHSGCYGHLTVYDRLVTRCYGHTVARYCYGHSMTMLWTML